MTEIPNQGIVSTLSSEQAFEPTLVPVYVGSPELTLLTV